MPYQIIDNLIPGVKQVPYADGFDNYRGVVNHSTANTQNAFGEVSYMAQNFAASGILVHYFVDRDCIRQTAAIGYRAAGAGPKANPYYVHVELCETRDPVKFRESYNRYVWLIAWLLFRKRKGVVDGQTCVSHAWVSKNLGGTDHQDPIACLASWGISWAQHVANVQAEYMKMEGGDRMGIPYNQVTKERIYASGGKLFYAGPKERVGTATDVRLLKIKKGAARFQFVYRKGAKVSDLVKEFGADYGINGPFFWDGQVLGDSEDHDKVISSAYGKMLKWHEFAAVDGSAQIGQIDKAGRQDFLVQGAPMLIENGNPCWDWYRVQEEVPDDIGRSRAQRTFVGVDAAGDLLIAIADGRTSWDQGLTLEEMALYMADKGAVNALNLDGGSSTVLADKTGGLNQKENTGVNERAVNHALLIWLQPAQSNPAPTPPPAAKDWKQNIHDLALQNGLLDIDWSDKLDEPAPVWMVLKLALEAKGVNVE